MNLNGKVALVTGASRGIGRAVAHELGKAGAIVAGTATTEAGAQAITEFFAQSGIKGSGFCLDVGSSEDVDSVLAQSRSSRRTSIGYDGIEIHTIEHLMAALAGLGIDNLDIEINNDELP
ncbi:MAG: UDP-3-O-acyl-N-acetylglucosamine deacetylase, partial [Gammaproteobacteria bacterium]|nr:UDP-3-O-acyl-N-acetylglucosamine deacetylase [Gammaproteobacteria bacterium]